MTWLRNLLSTFLFLLLGCSGNCTDSGVYGSYELTPNGGSYRLQLREGGQGVLSAADRIVGPLKWQLLQGPEQQMLELTASGDVFASLQKLRHEHGTPAVGTNGAFESVPQCSRKGSVRRIVINDDDDIWFSRVSSER
jgi:hypothetical protein